MCASDWGGGVTPNHTLLYPALTTRGVVHWGFERQHWNNCDDDYDAKDNFRMFYCSEMFSQNLPEESITGETIYYFVFIGQCVIDNRLRVTFNSEPGAWEFVH